MRFCAFFLLIYTVYLFILFYFFLQCSFVYSLYSYSIVVTCVRYLIEILVSPVWHINTIVISWETECMCLRLQGRGPANQRVCVSVYIRWGSFSVPTICSESDFCLIFYFFIILFICYRLYFELNRCFWCYTIESTMFVVWWWWHDCYPLVFSLSYARDFTLFRLWLDSCQCQTVQSLLFFF